ncbi:MAG: T9SS type A sorting domain-containing protein [Bacteroidia bacterium]|nr:T9SS type A sorting domain-containing protein [Bacteroidia bacterium]
MFLHSKTGNLIGYTAIAGKSVSGDTVTVLISDVNSNNTGYNLNVTNLPWENSGFIYEKYLLDSVYNAELSDTGSFYSNLFNIQNTMNSPSAHLIQLIKKSFLGHSEPEKLFVVEISPNPFSDEITLYLKQSCHGGVIVKIYDIFGREVVEPLYFDSDVKDIKISTKKFSKGIYLIKLLLTNMHVQSNIIIKQ